MAEASELISASDSQHWPTNKDDYELIEPIGVGSTAIVYSAYCVPRKENCAIKRINLGKWKNRINELQHLKNLTKHDYKYIVKYFTYFLVEDELWLVMELVKGGSLLYIINRKKQIEDCTNGVFNETLIATVMKKVLKALVYLHKNGQIHRDIKPENILLRENGTVQIAAFGVSAWIVTGHDTSQEERLRHKTLETQHRMTPEVMEESNICDVKVDIWNFGITAIEMAAGKLLYDVYSPGHVAAFTQQYEPPTIASALEGKYFYDKEGNKIIKMIASCLQKDPETRPTAAKLLKHPFFKKACNKKFLAKYLLNYRPAPFVDL